MFPELHSYKYWVKEMQHNNKIQIITFSHYHKFYRIMPCNRNYIACYEINLNMNSRRQLRKAPAQPY